MLENGLPSIVLVTLPIPSLLLLTLVTLYHLIPLLAYLPNIHLIPSLQRLSTVIPRPKRARNLPREFFNLPPRPKSPSGRGSEYDDIYILSVRGKIILLLAIQCFISLSVGWAFLTQREEGHWWMVAISSTLVPSTIMALCTFHLADRSTTRFGRFIFDAGGIDHSTIFARILPASLAMTGFVTVICAAAPSIGDAVIMAFLSLVLFGTLIMSVFGARRAYQAKQRGGIRLYGSEERVGEEANPADPTDFNQDSWVTSPSHASSAHISDFSYGSLQTPRAPSRPRSSNSRPSMRDALNDGTTEFDSSPNSWVTSPTTSPDTIPTWDYSPDNQGISSPQPAMTRSPRSPSPQPPASLAQPMRPTPPSAFTYNQNQGKVSKATIGSVGSSVGHSASWADQTMLSQYTTGTMASPGGSIVAAYEVDPTNPLPPRHFGSLASFPLSPEQMAKMESEEGGSRVSLATRLANSQDAITFVPQNRSVSGAGSSTWTLGSYHSAMEQQSNQYDDADTSEIIEPVTPANQKRGARKPKTPINVATPRAPPPPPMPTDMPLPPTPTVARSESAVDWQNSSTILPKESREWLMNERERDWVEVDGEVDGMEGWGEQGKGVGVLGLILVIFCYAFTVPLLLNGLTNVTQILYLISLLIPAPFLILASYLLRYRPQSTTRQAKREKSSVRTGSSHQSLALLPTSELPLPVSISPKLTPPNDRRMSVPTGRLSHFLEAKPSISNFGHARPLRARPHTIIGLNQVGGMNDVDKALRDEIAERQVRGNQSRQSGDVWIEHGHAVVPGNRLSRTAEMLKPVPAMVVLDRMPRETGQSSSSAMKKLRGGVVSMLPGRISAMIQDDLQDHDVPPSPIAINIESPSKHERRQQRFSMVSDITEGNSDDAIGDYRGNATADTEGEGMTTLRSAEIHVAQKGRMSHGPAFIYNRSTSRASSRHGQDEGYELDWLTAGVLPNLVPNIKIGPDVRVEPVPARNSNEYRLESAAPPKRVLQSQFGAGDNNSFIGEATFERDASEQEISMSSIPNFRGSLDLATPSRHGHARGHSRGQSNSVDFGKSPDFGDLKNHSTPNENGLRQRVIQHKPSFGLPKINPSDFESDIRRSIDELHSPQVEGDMGIDLPPFPSNLATRRAEMRAGRDLTPVSERDESNATAESTRMQRTLNELGGAIIALSSPASAGDSSRVLSEKSSRMNLSDLAPIILHGDGSFNHSIASIGSSIRTDEERLAEEMEMVMAMDTPTRAEFVISPTMSDYSTSVGGRDRDSVVHRSESRASAMSLSSMNESNYTMSTSAPPVPSTHALQRASSSSGWTSTDADESAMDRFEDAEEHPLPTLPIWSTLPPAGFQNDPLSQVGLNHRYSQQNISSHPHPPLQTSSSVPNFSRPAVTTAHPPVAIRQQMRELQKTHQASKSTETVRSEKSYSSAYTGYTSMSEVSPQPLRVTEGFTLSKHQRDMISQLKDRRQSVRPADEVELREAEGLDKGEKRRDKADKPLALVSEISGLDNNTLPKPSNRQSQKANPAKASSGSNKKKVSVYRNDENGDSARKAKMSTGSGKENARLGKGSKLSTGSGVTGIRA